jgi:hypothetical protein
MSSVVYRETLELTSQLASKAWAGRNESQERKS